MTILLILLGCLPFILGGLMHWLMMSNSFLFSNVGYIVVSILTLLLWAVLAYFIKPYIKSTQKVLIGMHAIPAFVLLLLVIQELFLHSYWSNFFGLLTQIYYLPLLRLSTILIGWLTTSLSVIFFVAFLLMIGAAFVGCKLRRK